MNPQDSRDAAGLAAAIVFDPTFAYDPARLDRALRDVDVAPRTAGLLVFAARLGVPHLLKQGEQLAAAALLADQGGLRADVANWLVALWSKVLPSSQNDRPSFGSAGRATEAVTAPIIEADPVESEAPTGPSLIRLASVSGGYVIAVATQDGFFVSVVTPNWQPPYLWRKLASPHAPLSRDIALARRPNGELLAGWSDHTGILSRLLSWEKDTAGRAVEVHLGPTQILVASATTEQPRYPVGLVSTGPDLIDVFWTIDRRQLLRSSLRSAAASTPPREIPPGCGRTERMTAMSVVPESANGVRLGVLTDLGRILLSRWDLGIDHHNEWSSATAPVAAMTGMAMTLTDDAGSPVVLASTSDGRVFLTGLSSDGPVEWPWRSLGVPPGLPQSPGIRALGAAPSPGGFHLVLAGACGAWLVTGILSNRRAHWAGDARQLLP